MLLGYDLRAGDVVVDRAQAQRGDRQRQQSDQRLADAHSRPVNRHHALTGDQAADRSSGGAPARDVVSDRQPREGRDAPAPTGEEGCCGAQTEVDRILHTGRGDGDRPRAQVEYSLGESVKVTSGPLSDFDGEVVDVNADQQKLKVLVDIFERQVPVELTFDQVKKLD